MNGKPGTRAELAALDHAIGLERVSGLDQEADLLESLRAKLTAPYKPKPDLPDVAAIELALGGLRITQSETYTAMLGRKAAKVGATVEDAKVIGPWLRAQPWGRDMTVDRVLAGWPSYLARARAAAQRTPDDGATRRDFDPGEVAG